MIAVIALNDPLEKRPLSTDLLVPDPDPYRLVLGAAGTEKQQEGKYEGSRIEDWEIEDGRWRIGDRGSGIEDRGSRD